MSNTLRFPDHDKLVQSGKLANEMLIKRGLQRKETLSELLAMVDNPPVLPGMPQYLPHKNVLVQAANMMYNFALDWKKENVKNPKREDDIVEFTTYIVKSFQRLTKKYKRECNRVSSRISKLKHKVPTVAELFKPLTLKQNSYALNKFFIDSFAVAIIVKKYDNTSDYVDWFLNDWILNLYKIWEKN